MKAEGTEAVSNPNSNQHSAGCYAELSFSDDRCHYIIPHRDVGSVKVSVVVFASILY